MNLEDKDEARSILDSWLYWIIGIIMFFFVRLGYIGNCIIMFSLNFYYTDNL